MYMYMYMYSCDVHVYDYVLTVVQPTVQHSFYDLITGEDTVVDTAVAVFNCSYSCTHT